MSLPSDFLRSALTEHNSFLPTHRVDAWLESVRARLEFRVRRIPFGKLRHWSFDPATGNLVHETGRFFSIEGIAVETNQGAIPSWSQPIINQPETGLLGFIVKEFEGVLHFLTQAKVEPGNINTIQLGPTIQATHSNYTRVHRGEEPPYLEYFVEPERAEARVDLLQAEQGARFLRKQNRNLIIEVSEDVLVHEDYCWLTLGQLHRLLQRDNCVNMDARSVIACVPLAAPEPTTAAPVVGLDGFRARLLGSTRGSGAPLHPLSAIVDWFTERKRDASLSVSTIPLAEVEQWDRTDTTIHHRDHRFFEVMAVAVEANSREVASWTQPMVRPQQTGIVALLCRTLGGVLHFLVQAKLEPGNFDVLELAPTVQCITGSYSGVPEEHRPPFLDVVPGASRGLDRAGARRAARGRSRGDRAGPGAFRGRDREPHRSTGRGPPRPSHRTDRRPR